MRKLLWLGCLSYLVIGMAHVVAGAVLEPFLDAYGLAYKDGGQWIMNQFLGFLVGVLGAPQLTKRLGRRGALILALLCLTAAQAAYSLMLPWTWILSFAFLSGFGFGMTETVIGSSIIEFIEEGKANAMSWLEVFFGVGALLMPAIAALLIDGGRWEWVFPIEMALAGLTAVLWMTLSFGKADKLMGRAARAAGGQGALEAAAGSAAGPGPVPASGARPRYTAVTLPFLIAGILFFLLYVGMEMSFSNYLPSMMIERTGMPTSSAATTMTIFWSAMVVGRLFCGRIAERIGYGRYLLYSVTGGMLVFVLIALSGSAALSIAYIALGGLLWSGVFAVGLLYVNHWIPGLTERTTSLMVAAGGLGGALLPRLMGWLMDRYDAEAALRVIAASAMVMLLLLVLQVVLGRGLARRRGETSAGEPRG